MKIHDFRLTVFYICCIIIVIVFSLLIYSLVKHRQSKGTYFVHFHSWLWLEIAWTVIPLLILVALAMPAAMILCVP